MDATSTSDPGRGTADLLNTEFRLVRPEDTGNLAALFRELDQGLFHPHPLSLEEAESVASKRGRDVFGMLWVDREPVAYGMLRGWDDGFDVPSLGVAVAVSRQGRGYGRRTMEALHDIALQRGAREVRLRVDQRNARARRLYKSMGYQLSGEERGEQVMTLDLRARLPSPSGRPAEGGSGPDVFEKVFRRAYRYSRRWDEGLWRVLELQAVKATLAELPELTRGPVLDIGCGNGDVFESIFGRRVDAVGVDSGATYASDIAEASTRGIYAEVRHEDARRTTFESETFSLAFSNSVFEHIQPVQPLLEEAFRILRPGGWLLFTTPDPILYARQFYFWRSVLARVGLDRVARALADRECTVYEHVSVLPFAEWSRRLTAAGFERAERRSYVDQAVARCMTRYSALTRFRVLDLLAPFVSAESRALSRAPELTEDEWVLRARAVLGRYVDPGREPSGAAGQLIFARRPA